MTAQKPTFRVMKNGYDRFAVDDAIDRYAAMVDQLQRKVELYQQQLVKQHGNWKRSKENTNLCTRWMLPEKKQRKTLHGFRYVKQIRLSQLHRKMQMRLSVRQSVHPD